MSKNVCSQDSADIDIPGRFILDSGAKVRPFFRPSKFYPPILLPILGYTCGWSCVRRLFAGLGSMALCSSTC